MPTQHFYAHGKLLLSGEYFVLDGAKALALPTRYGQSLQIAPEAGDDRLLFWNSRDEKGESFFSATFWLEDFQLKEKSGTVPHRLLQDLLLQARKVNPAFLRHRHNLTAISRLEFPPDWGLGSSSTLIYNIASWAGVDPFHLLISTIGGSGYDIACAGANSAILYALVNQQPVYREITFRPTFSENLFFIYLGKKQNSQEAIKNYRKLSGTHLLVEKISELTSKMIDATSLSDFEKLMNEHEEIVAGTLNLKKVKELYFGNFPGAIKSLGAWGGDFVMAASDENAEMVESYFHSRGFKTVLAFDEIFGTA